MNLSRSRLRRGQRLSQSQSPPGLPVARRPVRSHEVATAGHRPVARRARRGARCRSGRGTARCRCAEAGISRCRSTGALPVVASRTSRSAPAEPSPGKRSARPPMSGSGRGSPMLREIRTTTSCGRRWSSRAAPQLPPAISTVPQNADPSGCTTRSPRRDEPRPKAEASASRGAVSRSRQHPYPGSARSTLHQPAPVGQDDGLHAVTHVQLSEDPARRASSPSRPRGRAVRRSPCWTALRRRAAAPRAHAA